MPRKEKTVTTSREEFVVKAVAKEESFSALCREYGITRKTGYKWLNRHMRGETLGDKSRRPFHTPNTTPQVKEELVLTARESHPAWGPRKLHRSLQDAGHVDVPPPSTIAAILKRNDGIALEDSLMHTPYCRFERSTPNELWQMDFKGDFAMCNGNRCYPFTALDDHSRFSLAIDAKPNQLSGRVFESVDRMFREYGLPQAILCDNGVPWGSSKYGYTHFEIWLMQLDILPIHGRPYHPQTQGKEERFHRTMKAELLRYHSMNDLQDAQSHFDLWRNEYNNERPHHALGLAVPASKYRSSKRTYTTKAVEPVYEPGRPLRKVNCKGYISVQRHRYFLSELFAGRFIELIPIENQTVRLCYGNFEIARIDLSQQQFVSRKIYPRLNTARQNG